MQNIFIILFSAFQAFLGEFELSKYSVSVSNNQFPTVYVSSPEQIQPTVGKRFQTHLKVVKYSVEVQHGLAMAAWQVSKKVEYVLNHPQGWEQIENVDFQRVDPKLAQLRIVIATPTLTNRMCYPLRTNGIFSCRNRNFVVLNSTRFVSGSRHWRAGIEDYRTYLINHEIGHFLGYAHQRCARRGALAPVMMQQTKGLFGCVENQWP